MAEEAWGRWGKEDERGALNYIGTPEVLRADGVGEDGQGHLARAAAVARDAGAESSRSDAAFHAARRRRLRRRRQASRRLPVRGGHRRHGAAVRHPHRRAVPCLARRPALQRILFARHAQHDPRGALRRREDGAHRGARRAAQRARRVRQSPREGHPGHARRPSEVRRARRRHHRARRRRADPHRLARDDARRTRTTTTASRASTSRPAAGSPKPASRSSAATTSRSSTSRFPRTPCSPCTSS